MTVTEKDFETLQEWYDYVHLKGTDLDNFLYFRRYCDNLEGGIGKAIKEEQERLKMNGFEIIDLEKDSTKYRFVVINRDTNSITSKFDTVDGIEWRLRNKNYKGKVLICNLTFCRNFDKSFSEIEFDGEHFKASTWNDVQLKDLEKGVIVHIKDYFKKDPDILLNSILPDVED